MRGMDQSERSSAAWAQRLVEIVVQYQRVAVAFSGGVDSAVVAKAAMLALGDQAVAITGVSPSLSEGELESARNVARHIGIRHELAPTREFANPSYVRNDGTRCYHCKSELYDCIASLRETFGFDVVCSGANLDDLGDYRPGLRAAAERGVRHPLQEAGMNKQAVRETAQYWGLPNWDKPAMPCLSSRLAVGVEATPERTERVRQAEACLGDLGLVELRVRYHPGDHARIEAPAEHIAQLAAAENRAKLVARFKQIGFKFVSLDLEGFRSGSLNVLNPEEIRVDLTRNSDLVFAKR